MTLTIQLRRRLADGTNPAHIVVTTIVTTFPNGGGQYFGNSQTGLGIVIPAGYYVYGYVSGRSTTDNDGVSVWGRFQKG